MNTLRVATAIFALVSACTRAGDEPRSAPAAATSQALVEHDVTSTPEQRVIAQLTDPPRVPAGIYRTKPAHVVVNLEVTEVEREIAPGVRYTLWTFGGEVPGKFIRVRQGDVVELRLQNHPSSKMPHNIDLHAVTGPGGGAEATFTAPGQETQVTFRATNPGLYVYHCATAPVPMHVANGMYGLILVEPPGGLGWADHEFYVMQGELYTTGGYHAPGLQAFDMEKGIDERPTYVLFNGAEGSLVGPNALKAKTGDTVRIYIGNGGPNLVSSFHVIGEIFDKVYFEGGTRVQENVQTTLIPAGGAAIVEFQVDVPGTYNLVDHSLFRAFNKGAVGQLVVEGPSRKDLFSGNQLVRDYAPKATATATAPAAAPTPVAPRDAASFAKETYGRVCAACHQADGQGMAGAFPPVAKSDYVAKATTTQLITHVVQGLQGEITVNGATYNGVMPPMAYLSDDEVAGALSFVRGMNDLGPIHAAEVAKVRAGLEGGR